MKKFLNFTKDSDNNKQATDSTAVFENFINKYSSVDNREKKSTQSVEMFENVLSELNNLVKKEELSELLVSQLIVIEKQFDQFKKQVLETTSNVDVNKEVDNIISKAKFVIEKVSNESESYNKKYYEDKISNTEKFESIDKKFNDLEYTSIVEKIDSFDEKVTTLFEVYEQNIPEQNKKINNYIFSNNEDNENLKSAVIEILEDFENRVDSGEENVIEIVSGDLNKIQEKSKKSLEEAKQELVKKITESKIQTIQFEKNLKKFNKEFSVVKEDIKTADSKLDKQLNRYKLLEDKQKDIVSDVKSIFKTTNNLLVSQNKIFESKKFKDLNTKIKFLEETLEKFNEKTLITEDLVAPASTTTRDPLTPLDKNFVTFDDLKRHYTLFINRVQQQMASIGGGGAVRIDQLDDVNIRDATGAVNIANGQSLVYITSSKQFEARTVTSGAAGSHTVIGGFSGVVSNANVAAIVTSSGILKTANVVESTNLYFANSRANGTILANLITSVEAPTAGVTDVGSRRVFYSNTRANAAMLANVTHSLERHLILAASDETSDLETGTATVTFHAPIDMTLTRVPRITVQTAPAGSTIVVDINDDGSTILSTKLSIDAGEKTSKTAATAGVLSATEIADDSILTVDIDQIGSGTAGKGLKLILYYRETE